MAVSLWLTGGTTKEFQRLRLRFCKSRGIASKKEKDPSPESRRLSAMCCAEGAVLACKNFSLEASLILILMHTISRDSPCYYLTSVSRDRLPVFQATEIKLVTCAALDEARCSGGFALYAYVIMPDHLHVITDSVISASRTLQFINGITAHRII